MDELGRHALRARELFLGGYNCAQAVFTAFAEEADMDERLALRTASTLGGGVVGSRQLCGAVSGMLLALGAIRGCADAPDQATKKALYDTGKALMARFTQSFETTNCGELLRRNGILPTPDPAARDAAYYRDRPCLRYVEAAAQLLEKELTATENG